MSAASSGATPEELLEQMTETGSTEWQLNLRRELDSIHIEELTEEAASALWDEVSGGAFVPTNFGWTMVDWFRRIDELDAPAVVAGEVAKGFARAEHHFARGELAAAR